MKSGIYFRINRKRHSQHDYVYGKIVSPCNTITIQILHLFSSSYFVWIRGRSTAAASCFLQLIKWDFGIFIITRSFIVIFRDQLLSELGEEETRVREVNEPRCTTLDYASRSTPRPFPILPRTVT